MSKEYSPEVVGQSFIKQYYEMFAKNPSELHRFYKDESSFSHAEGHQVISSVSSIESIRETIAQLGLTGCRLDLSEGSIDAQRSEQGGVFLVVTGNLMLPGKPYHHFVQSFFLACQSNKGTAPSYYVRNSIFRLLGVVHENVSETSEVEQTVVETIAPVAVTSSSSSSSSPSPNNTTTTTTPITTTAVELEVHQSPVSEQVNEIVENTSPSSPVQEVQEQEETQMNGFDDVHVDHNTIVSEPDYVNVSIPENTDSQNEDDQQDENDGGYTSTSSSSRAGGAQPSFAELVKGWNNEGRGKTTDAPQAHVKSKPKSSKTSNHASSSSSSNSNPTSNTNNATTTTSSSAATTTTVANTTTSTESNSPQVVNQTTQEKGSSSNHHHHHHYNSPSALYLNQLPEEVTTPEQLSHLFLPYGTIRKIDVHPKGYAFVNYYDAAVVAKVLEIVATTPEVFSINGKVIQVKEKLNKPKSTGGKDKKVGEKIKKEGGWKPKGGATSGGNSGTTGGGGGGGVGTQGEKVHTGEKKSFNRNKTEKAQIAKVSKK